MSIKPARGYCLIEPLEQEEISSQGVYLPERAKDLPNRGKVLAVGKNQFLQNGQQIDSEIKEGDIVIYKKFIDNKIKKEDKEYLLVSFQDILAIDNDG